MRIKMSIGSRRKNSSGNFDMQLIGNFLSFASRGDRVGLNQMLIDGISPNVQDYDSRTALHLAASEGHASIVELLLQYKADVNLEDRWFRTPLTDARLYGHRDICRILEVNGGTDTVNNNKPMTVRRGEDSNEVNIDISELSLQQFSAIKQGEFGASEKVKWRGTLVVKTVIKRHISHPVKMVLSATDNTLLRELRHPNILQFLGSIVQGEEMILITEYLPEGNLDDILTKRVRLDVATALRFALDIARGMNYLHHHKPFPIVHNHLTLSNLLQDEGGHLKIGEYWVQMLYQRIHPNQDSRQRDDKYGIISNSNDITKDIYSFGQIFYQMLKGKCGVNDPKKLVDFEPKFHLMSRNHSRIQELIEKCTKKNSYERPSFTEVITILEEVSQDLGKACPVVC